MKSVTVRAHGRVNLIGEHTDYNGGWVLPTTIPQFTEVTMTKNDSRKVYLISFSDKGNTRREFSYELGKETPTDTWSDYLQGATKFVQEKGSKLTGLTAHIRSTIPEGSGVSSSAALEMSFLKALKEIFQLNLNPIELAKLGQKIENDFVGARVGIMDQMATGLGQKGHALFLDTFTMEFERIKIPTSIELMVINSGIIHKLSQNDGGYNQRRMECEEACKLLDISLLRDISFPELKDKNLPPKLMKRARHVVTENERVHKAAKALRENHPQELGRLFYESHVSMKNDFEISIPEIDYLVEKLSSYSETFGARLTGGGFGGSIVAITSPGSGKKIAEEVMEAYYDKFHVKATQLV